MKLGAHRHEAKCIVCGKLFWCGYTEMKLHCSVGCQIHDDPIEPIQRTPSRSRPARVARTNQSGDRLQVRSRDHDEGP